MNKMRFAQGGVFLGASFLVIVVGLRGIHPDSVPLAVIYAALGIETVMLIAIGILIIAGNGLNGNNRLQEVQSTLADTDAVITAVLGKLNPTTSLPPDIIRDVAELKGKIRYLQGVVKDWQ